MSLREIEEVGYPHFMLKEIVYQPNTLRNAMRGVSSKRCLMGDQVSGLEKLAGEGKDKRS